MKQYGLNTKLSVACCNNDIETIDLLIEQGADVHYNYEYPLWCACHRGHAELSKYLINKYKCKITYSMLSASRYINNWDLINYLIDTDKGNMWNCYNCLKRFKCKEACEESRYISKCFK